METSRTDAGKAAAETSGAYPSEERQWGPSLEVGLGWARLNAGSNRANSYGLEANAGLWSRFTPTFKLRVSWLVDFQRLEGAPFQRKAKDPNPDLISMGLRTGLILSANNWLDLGLNLSGGTSYFSGMAGSGGFAEGGLLACVLKDHLCLEGAIRAYGLLYETGPENSPAYYYGLPQMAVTKGFAGGLRATSYWDF